jgi:hypothetical protein
MNFLPKINSDSAILGYMPLRYILYCFLLTDCLQEEDEHVVYSCYDNTHLYKKFRQFTATQIDEAIDELVEEGLITIEDTFIHVGVCSGDGLCKLYSFSQHAIEDYTRIVTDALDAYVEDANGIAIARAKRTKANFEALSALKPHEYKHGDFVKLWLYAYEGIMQESHREFMQKEHGQLKRLRTQYDPEVLYKLIIYFLNNSHLFGKTPNLDTFTYKKDTIYLKMVGKTKKVGSRSHMRKKIVDEGF